MRRHPISECSASPPDRRRRPGSTPCPPAPARRRLGPGPPPARSSLSSESSEQLPSVAPRWPHSESLGPECATTWSAVRRRVALRSSIVGVAFRADGCLLSSGRARSESVSASCAMVAWALSMVLIDLPFSHWTHVTFKQRKLDSLVTTQIVCESRRHSLFRRQSKQQQEQCAGSLRVKILYPKHTVYHLRPMPPGPLRTSVPDGG